MCDCSSVCCSVLTLILVRQFSLESRFRPVFADQVISLFTLWVNPLLRNIKLLDSRFLKQIRDGEAGAENSETDVFARRAKKLLLAKRQTVSSREPHRFCWFSRRPTSNFPSSRIQVCFNLILPPQKNLKGGPVFWILFLLPNPSGGRSGRVTSMGPGSRPRRPRPRRRSLRSWGLTWRRAVHRSLETSGGRRKTPRWPRAAPAWTRGHLAGFARPYAHDLQGSTGHPERRSS